VGWKSGVLYDVDNVLGETGAAVNRWASTCANAGFDRWRLNPKP